MASSIFVVDTRCHAERSRSISLPYSILCHPECNEGSQGLRYRPTPRRPRDSSLKFRMTECCVQNDTLLRHCEAWNKPWQSHAVCHAERSRSISSLATHYPPSLREPLGSWQSLAVCHAERSRSIPSLSTHYPRSRLSAFRRFFVTLRMTTQAIITN